MFFMKFLLAKKHSMTQVFTQEGEVVPVTVLESASTVVTQVKDKERDGYKAVQVGFGERKSKNLSKPVLGHLKELGSFAVLKEFRIPQGEESRWNVGDKINLSIFSVGDRVAISAISKGKGFQGVVKRHGFKGGPRSHGQKHSEREPGSIGGGLRTRVPKGMRMAGRMGGDRTTLKDVKIEMIDSEKGQIIVRGAVPGRRGTLVEIRSRNERSERKKVADKE
jgi:large subunit ribosomal protein L3